MSYNRQPTRASGGRGTARFGPAINRKPVPTTPAITVALTPARDTKNFRIFETAPDECVIATVYAPLSHLTGQSDEIEIVVRRKPAKSRAAKAGKTAAA